MGSSATEKVTEKVTRMAGASSGPVGSNDPLYDKPYVDIDEWREDPVRHRYVHGGFGGTECRFSIYFPPPERYEGRFFQPLMAVSGQRRLTTQTRPSLPGAYFPALRVATQRQGDFKTRFARILNLGRVRVVVR